jgi:CRISPR-associated protein Csm3
MRLIAIREVKGTLTLLSGLHIGGGSSVISLRENPVVYNSRGEPFIPGSSLKGKLRFLLESASGLLRVSKGRPLTVEMFNNTSLSESELAQGKLLLSLFGSRWSEASGQGGEYLGPARALFRDARLQKSDLPLIEVKAEGSVNRARGTIERTRSIERVPEGHIFSFAVGLRIYEGDNEEDLSRLLLKGLRLLEHDALGGHGSRGYGRVQCGVEGHYSDAFSEVQAFAS